MLIFLMAMALFASVLFWQSTGIPWQSGKRGLLCLYFVLAGLTLIFQVYVRSYACEGLAGCTLSFSKAVVWAFIWPTSWLVYLAGL